MSETHHPIQVVARRTGLTVDTLRAWEKRYSAVEPHRAPNGRRVYSDEDIERLLLLRRATDGGRRIGQVAQLGLDALQELVAEDASAKAAAPPPRRRGQPAEGAAPEEFRESCLQAVINLDAKTLDATLARAQLALPTRRLLTEVIAPLLEEIGDRWHSGNLRVSSEHLASVSIRTLLQVLSYSQPLADRAPTVVVTTPAGQIHDLGALMAAVMAATAGWRSTFLGADLPAEEIAAAAEQTDAKAVILSLIYPNDDPRIGMEIARTRRLLAEDVALIVGGRAVDGYQRALTEAGALVAGTLDDVPNLLNDLRSRG